VIDRRTLTLQLTPLLDLLLIVFFAQYMEVRLVSDRKSEQAESRVAAANADLDKLRQQLAELQKQLADWEQQQRQADQSGYESREQLGKLFGELFQLPESIIERITRQRSSDEAVLSSAEIEALTSEFRTLSTARADQVVDHLLTFAEMKKRFDVWEIHVQGDNSVLITAGPHQKRLQPDEAATPELFNEEFFKLYKSFPQSKNVVLILVSYGNSQLRYRWSVTRGLPAVTERMRLDSNGQVKFEYAVLGFRPDASRRP